MTDDYIQTFSLFCVSFSCNYAGAMKDSIHALKRGGFLHLLPVTDEAGRAVIYSVR